MSHGGGQQAWPSFRVALAMTDAEITAFQQIVLRKQRNVGARRRGLTLFIASFAIGLLGGWLLTEAGAVRPGDEGLVSVVFYAVYWLSYAIAVISASGPSRQLLREGLAETRARLVGASMLVMPAGAFIRLADARSFYRRSSIEAATLEKGLVFLWGSYHTARPIICVPARLLQPAEQERLLSLGRAAQAPTATSAA